VEVEGVVDLEGVVDGNDQNLVVFDKMEVDEHLAV